MNLFALNGAAINGTYVHTIAASVDIACTADVGATATREARSPVQVLGSVDVSAAAIYIGNGVVKISCTADFTDDPTFIEAGRVDILGLVDVYNNPQHIQAGVAYFDDGSASIVAAVYRNVPAAASIDLSVDVSVIPASLLGAADFNEGSADVSPDATQVQPGSSAFAGTAAFDSAPYVIRNVVAPVTCVAAFRVEAQVNNNVDGFADCGGTADFAMPDIGIVIRGAHPEYIELFSNASAKATYIICSASAHFDTLCDMSGDGSVHAVPTAYIHVLDTDTSITADATRIVFGQANYVVTADMKAPALQNFAGAVGAVGSANIAVNVQLIQALASNVVGSIGMVVDPYIERRSPVNATCGANFVANATYTGFGAVAVDAGADMQPAPMRICLASVDGVLTANFAADAQAVREGAAHVTVDTASIAPNAMRTTFSTVPFVVGAAVNAGAITRMTGSALFNTALDFTPDARLNIEAYDPVERTMRRPFNNTEMRRPFNFTEMRRAA